MKNYNIKKSSIIKELNLNSLIYETYGKKPQEIVVSEEQLTRLMEKQYNEQLTPPVNAEVGDTEDFYTDMTVTNEEDIFDDYRHERPNYEKGEFTPGYTGDQSEEGFKEDEIGAYLNMDKLRDEMDEEAKPDFLDLDKDGNKNESMKKASKDMKEDSEGEETYNYSSDEGHDEYRLKHDDMSGGRRRNLKKDMSYDEDHEDRGEYGTHFESVEDLYHKSQLEQIDLMIAETFTSVRKSIIRERIGKLNRKNYLLSEQQSEWRGRNPGVAAAGGIENIIANLKKAWTFVKDEKTRKQIMNTLTKLNNFMTYTAELIGSGQKQSGARGYDQVTDPIPYPDLDEPEELEDIDDDITLS